MTATRAGPGGLPPGHGLGRQRGHPPGHRAIHRQYPCPAAAVRRLAGRQAVVEGGDEVQHQAVERLGVLHVGHVAAAGEHRSPCIGDAPRQLWATSWNSGVLPARQSAPGPARQSTPGNRGPAASGNGRGRGAASASRNSHRPWWRRWAAASDCGWRIDAAEERMPEPQAARGPHAIVPGGVGDRLQRGRERRSPLAAGSVEPATTSARVASG